MATFDIEFEVPLIATETEATVHCEFSVTSWGSSDSWMQPGDPIEWDIEKIWVDEAEIPYSPDEYECSLWQALATACDTYIRDNFDFSNNYPEPYED